MLYCESKIAEIRSRWANTTDNLPAFIRQQTITFANNNPIYIRVIMPRLIPQWVNMLRLKKCRHFVEEVIIWTNDYYITDAYMRHSASMSFKHPSIKNITPIHSAFLSFYVDYCNLVWHFCSNISLYKLKNLISHNELLDQMAIPTTFHVTRGPSQ